MWGLWKKVQPLAEDAAVDAAAEDLLRAPHAGAARRANEKLAEALGPDAVRCLAEFKPRDCARPVAEALRKRYGGAKWRRSAPPRRSTER